MQELMKTLWQVNGSCPSDSRILPSQDPHACRIPCDYCRHRKAQMRLRVSLSSISRRRMHSTPSSSKLQRLGVPR